MDCNFSFFNLIKQLDYNILTSVCIQANELQFIGVK